MYYARFHPRSSPGRLRGHRDAPRSAKEITSRLGWIVDGASSLATHGRHSYPPCAASPTPCMASCAAAVGARARALHLGVGGAEVASVIDEGRGALGGTVGPGGADLRSKFLDAP